jgi:hypothetical protein
MAISTGTPDLIRLLTGRAGALTFRRMLADFHREAALGSLFCDANLLEREAFAMAAIDRHLADALTIAVCNGLRLWSSLTRDLITNWPACRSSILSPFRIRFVPPLARSSDLGYSGILNHRTKWGNSTG